MDTCKYGCLRQGECTLTIDPDCDDPISFDICKITVDETSTDAGIGSNDKFTPIIGMSIIVIQGLFIGTICRIYDRKQIEDKKELFKSNYF